MMAVNITFSTRRSLKIELRGEHAGFAEAGALEEKSERDADGEGDDEREFVAEETVFEERRVHSHCLRKNQASA
jgi:hypothetical protein